MSRAAAIVGAALLAASAATAAAGDLGWQWASPLPPAVDLTDLIPADGKLLAVGIYGTIVSSTDGRVWTVEDAVSSARLTAVASGAGVRIAVGEELTEQTPHEYRTVVLTSANGGRWRERARLPSDGEGWYDAAFGAGRFVVVDGTTRMLTSIDGESWQVVDDAFDEEVSGVAWNGTTFLAIGLRGGYLSEDGVIWRSVGPAPWHAVATPTPSVLARRLDVGWDGSQFVAFVGDTLSTSDDGGSWTEQKRFGDTAAPECVGLRAPTILAIGSNFPDGGVPAYQWLEVSSDGGQTWSYSLPYHDVTTWALQGLQWSGSEWVGVGNAGTVLLSDDGMEWACPQGGACRGDEWWFDSAVDGPAGLVALGSSAWYSWAGLGWPPNRFPGDLLVVRRSPGGTWSTTTVSSAEAEDLTSLAADGSRYVSVGGQDAAVSVDGLSWTLVPRISANPLSDVTWGQGVFIAVGEHGTVATSTDGNAWSIGSAGVTEDLSQVLATEDGFFALGAEGTVLQSSDARQWSALPGTAGGNARQIAVGDTRLVAVGGSGLLRTYSEAEGWVDRMSVGVDGDTLLTGAAWGGTRFAVVGVHRALDTRVWTYDEEPRTLASRDGVHWTLVPNFAPAPAAIDFKEVFATSTGFVAVGENRTLVEATDFGTLLELDPPVGRILLNQPATLQVGIDEARDEPTVVLMGASSGAIDVPRLVTIPAGATSVGVPIRGTRVEAGVEIRAELSDKIGGGIAISRLSVEGKGPRRPGGRKAEPAGAAKAARMR